MKETEQLYFMLSLKKYLKNMEISKLQSMNSNNKKGRKNTHKDKIEARVATKINKEIIVEGVTMTIVGKIGGNMRKKNSKRRKIISKISYLPIQVRINPPLSILVKEKKNQILNYLPKSIGQLMM